mmetsp:Transcript_18446/g.24366  ORF Transcript_18446/g.24366 Transcript_18446/m.24366 type:complete len:1067 (+) Transcript_18446:240-3440(+)
MRSKSVPQDQRNDFDGNIFESFAFGGGSQSKSVSSENEVEEIMSSDDDEGNGWLEKRNANKMSSQERKQNITNARRQRLRKGKKSNLKEDSSGTSSSDGGEWKSNASTKKRRTKKSKMFPILDMRKNPSRAAKNKKRRGGDVLLWLDDDSDYSDGMKKKKKSPPRKRKGYSSTDESEGSFSESKLAGDSEEEASSSESEDLDIYHEEDLKYMADAKVPPASDDEDLSDDDQEPIIANEPKTNGFTQKSKQTSDECWICSACTLRNEAGTSICGACEAPRSSLANGSSWACKKCTFLNTEKELVCEACQTSRPSSGAEPISLSSEQEEDLFVIEDSEDDSQKPQKKRSRIQKGKKKEVSKIDKALLNARERRKADAKKSKNPLKRTATSRAERAQNRRAKRIVDDDEEPEFKEEDFPSSEDDGAFSGGESDDYDDEANKRERAREVLEKCTELSTKLRKVIENWQTDGPNEGDCTEENTRINLVDMSTEANNEQQEFVTQEKISSVCPGLTLKNYQLVGVNWLYVLHNIGLNGVLADEMGLGKTIQTIAFMAFVKGRHEAKGAAHRTNLVVVPASTLGNWANEIEKFCPDLEVMVYQGPQAERAQMRRSFKESGMKLDVILTTYSCFELESAGQDRKFFKSFKFGYMVLDEAHSIKNQDSSRFKKLSMIKSERRLLLSGTPVQNKLEELMSLLSFLMPKIFQGCTEALMEFLQVQVAIEKVNIGDPIHTQTFKKIQNILTPFVLRRLKSEVLGQLPPKTTALEYLECQGLQKEVYVNLLKSHAAKIAGNSGSGQKTKMKAAEAKHIFTDLRKASNHPLLLRVHFNEPNKMDHISRVLLKRGHYGPQATLEMVQKETAEYSDYDLHHVCSQYKELSDYTLDGSNLFSSAKFQKLHEILPKLQADGHRILLFSQWTRILDLLEVFLERLDMQFLRLDGSTDVKERQSLIARFNHDLSIPVFLLSTRAGGLGINLTAADTVILHDLDWNPTNDQQAEDRCHRIGQTRPVQVIKLVVKDTVDEDIYTIGNRKSIVTAKVLDEEKGATTKRQPDSKTISQILVKALQQNALL